MTSVVAAILLLGFGPGTHSPVVLATDVQTDVSAKRVAERLAALRREADELDGREKTLLSELRKFEIERQIKTEELTIIQANLKTTQQALAEAGVRAAALRRSADTQQPEVEDRLIRLYKMGRAGYWRLLLDVEDLQSVGRAYRTAAALTRLDRDRVRRHQATLEALDRERGELQARQKQSVELQANVTAARIGLDRALASRAAVIASIASRRDLTAQLATELDAAHLRLQSALAQTTGTGQVTVPIRPFRGEMPWPANGIVVQRFGRQPAGRVAGISVTRNGIELSLAEGHPVVAVHDGTVTQTGPFAGYGQLVIIDHGGGAASLYGHLAAVNVDKGDRVGAGAPVGVSGRNTGGNPALYFELRVDGKPVDPLQWLRKQP